MRESYNADLYLTPDDLNYIEEQIEILTKKIQEVVYGNQNSSLKTIEQNDNLNGKTLYLSFPQDLYTHISTHTSKPYTILKTDKGHSINEVYILEEKIATVSINYKDKNYFLYAIDKDSTEPFLNYVRFKLPGDFGEVITGDTLMPELKYMKFYENENIIPNYVKKTWNVNEILYMQDIDNIEQGIKNIGNYFTKPIGWQSARDWFYTNTIDVINDYGVSIKNISYLDINRWLVDLRLANKVDMYESTIWNTDYTQYEWEDHTNWIYHNVLYDNENVLYDNEDVTFYYID